MLSYLDVPRIHFSGDVFADPSTVNNTESNYDPASALDNAWNPNGKHWFFLQNCKINQVVTKSGSIRSTSAQDKLISGSVETTNVPAMAKMVDLDPDEQLRSRIFGAKFKFNLSSGGGFFQGDLVPPTLRDLWFQRSPGGLAGAGGVFQTIIENVTWNTASRSPVFDQLKATGNKLSIKFVLYAYQTSSTTCKIVGVVGPATTGEELHFLSERRLISSSGSSYGFASFKVDSARKKLILDLCNALPEKTPDGDRKDLGKMTAVIHSGAGLKIGEIKYDKAHYLRTAGIEELTLNTAQLTAIKSNRLLIKTKKGSGPEKIILNERNTGYVNVDEVRFCINPGEDVTVKFTAKRFGKAKNNQKISLKLASGTPASAIQFPSDVKTNAGGTATATIKAKDPGNPRGDLDGQIFKIFFYWGSPVSANKRGRITVKIFDKYTVPTNPKWSDVRKIFEQYARLYPAMNSIIKLGDQGKLKNYINGTSDADRKKLFIGIPEDDPRYMPVSRDLSKDKKKLILKWIAAGMP